MTQRPAASELLPGALACVQKYAAVGDTDSVLIIFDNSRIADALLRAVKDTSKAEVNAWYLGALTRPERDVSKTLKQALERATVVFTVFDSLDAEDNFRGAVLDYGNGSRRIFHMPGATEEMFTGAGALGLSNEELETMVALTKELAVLLSLSSKVRIRSGIFPKTDLSFGVGDTENTATMSTGHVKRGSWGNLPSGEAFTLPRGVLPNGHLVIDRAVEGIAPGFDPIELAIVNGQAQVGRNGGQLQAKLKAAREEANAANRTDENVARICEFGIGTNPKASANVMLEVEKVLGTIHVALGDNTIFKGSLWAPNHIDMVISRPTISIDDQFEILSDGVVNRDTIQAYPKVAYPAFRGVPVPDGYTIRYLKERVSASGDRLSRKWKDHRGNEYSVHIGDFDTSVEAYRVASLLGPGDRLTSVSTLIKDAKANYSLQPEDTTAICRVLERFGVAEFVSGRGETVRVV